MFRRFSDASATCLMCSGRLFKPCHPGLRSGFRLKPNFVAMTTLSRMGESAFPTRISFVSGPYNSAVSKKLMPMSTALCMSWIISFSSRTAGYEKLRLNSHAAKSEGGHFEIAFSEFAHLHKISLRRRNDSLQFLYFQGDVVIPVRTYLD